MAMHRFGGVKHAEPPTPPPPPKESLDLSAPLRSVDIENALYDQAVKNAVPMPLDLVEAGAPVPSDLFLPRLLRQEKRVALTRVLEAGRPPTARMLRMLRAAGLDTFYCPRDQLGSLLEFLAEKTARRLSDPATPRRVKARLVYDQACLIVEQAMNETRLGPNLRHGARYVEAVTRFVRHSPGALRDLADMLATDYALYTHSVNVCLLATAFAAHLGLEDAKVIELGMGALYHDLGKRDIPASILGKPGPLSTQEWEIMRTHPRRGYELLRDYSSIPHRSLRIILLHHENLDGTGYPTGIKEGQLRRSELITRLVDAYDAITSVRVYKEGRMAFEGIRLLQEDSSKVSMDLLRRFVPFLGLLQPRNAGPSAPGGVQFSQKRTLLADNAAPAAAISAKEARLGAGKAKRGLGHPPQAGAAMI